MRAWVVPAGAKSVDDLKQIDRPDRAPGAGEARVRVRAVSLNYRDQLVVNGTYFTGPVTRDLVPLSDGAGDVIAIGDGVSRLRVGDRVAATFFQRPLGANRDGAPAALGAPLDGMLAEHVTLSEDGWVPIPPALSFEEAACFPCAGVTAWHALFHAGRPINSGDTVLVLGTGGVSIFALLFARAAGARVIATSSTDEKLDRLTRLGASEAINYRRSPDWDKEVMRLTSGRWVDCVIEVGGAGTLAKSIQALAREGKVCLIGFLAGRDGDTSPFGLMSKAGSMHGIFVGDRPMYEAMNRAVAVNRIRPVVDRIFSFDEAVAAYKYQASGAFMGKVVITV